MSDQSPVVSPSGALPATIRFLLIPSWVVGLGVALIAVDMAIHVIEEPLSQMIGNIVLIGGFLVAPLATLLAAALGIWYSVRRARRAPATIAGGRSPHVWTLIALSFLCILAAWIMMARNFTS